MDLSVVAVVATIAAGVSILVAVAAVFAARRSTAHADLALKEASRISRASISRINEVQSEANSARMAARHAAERLHSMTKERTTPDSVAAYRVFLREVVEDSKHLLGPEGTGTMKNEALDRLRVGALVGGSDEVLRAMRNFALLRSQRPEAPWPSAYAMAYARLEADLVTAIRNDLGSSEESLTADQIWGAVNARCVDPAFRLALGGVAVVTVVGLAVLHPGFSRLLSLTDEYRARNTETGLAAVSQNLVTLLFGTGEATMWPWMAYESTLVHLEPDWDLWTPFGPVLPNPHSTYLWAFVELGGVGLVLLLAALWPVLRGGLRRGLPPLVAPLAMALLLSLVSFATDTHLVKNFPVALVWWFGAFVLVRVITEDDGAGAEIPVEERKRS